jgi:hypothetical protein
MQSIVFYDSFTLPITQNTNYYPGLFRQVFFKPGNPETKLKSS